MPVPAATRTGTVPKFVGRGRVDVVVEVGDPDEYGVVRALGV